MSNFLTPGLFDDDSGTTEMVPVRSISFGASKKAKALNRLLAQVESLREEYEQEKRRLDDALVLHAAQVRPRQERLTALRTDLVRALARFLDDRRISKTDQRTLRDVLIEQVDEILAHQQAPGPDIEALFQRLHGLSLAQAVEASLSDARESMSDLLDEMGLDIDLPDLRADMTDAEVAASAAQMAARLREAHEKQEDGRARRPKTKRQIREEQRAAERAARQEQMRKISLGAIYKRLVKALHPDLELDADARRQRVEVMQDVTAAYRANDLSALLRLELQWLGGAGDDAARQTDETLGAYSELLRGQAAELREAIFGLRYQPRYADLVDTLDPLDVIRGINPSREVERLDAGIEGLTLGLTRLLDEQVALKEVRELLRTHRKARRGASPF